MGQLVLLVVAAAWAAVLIPPLLRSRIENRPNSSVSDFRNQLSSLQRAMPSRGVAMRSMARPLAPSPLSRPAATGPPAAALRRAHPRRRRPATPRPQPSPAARAATAPACTTPRPAAAATATGPHARPRAGRAGPLPVADRAALKRRRANVLFVLGARRRRARCSSPPPPRRRRCCTCSALSFVALCRLRLRARPAAPARAGAGPGAGPGRAASRPASRRPSALGAPPVPASPSPPEVAPGVGAAVRARPAGRRPTAGQPPSDAGRSHADPLPSPHAPRRYTRGVLGAVAQLVERNNRTVEARGSIPLSSTRESDAPAVWRGHQSRHGRRAVTLVAIRQRQRRHRRGMIAAVPGGRPMPWVRRSRTCSQRSSRRPPCPRRLPSGPSPSIRDRLLTAGVRHPAGCAAEPVGSTGLPDGATCDSRSGAVMPCVTKTIDCPCAAFADQPLLLSSCGCSLGDAWPNAP